MKPYLKIIASAKESALDKLHAKGVKDKFVVKLKKPDGQWVAQYRGGTQFTGRGRGPIFWVSEELLDSPKQFVLSLLHEYGHVVAEWAYARSPAIAALLKEFWPGSEYGRPWAEEDFAEDFAHYLEGGLFLGDAMALEQIIAQYVIEVFEGA